MKADYHTVATLNDMHKCVEIFGGLLVALDHAQNDEETGTVLDALVALRENMESTANQLSLLIVQDEKALDHLS